MEDLSQNIKGRRGHERDVEVEEVVHLPAGGGHQSNINICEGVGAIFTIFSTQMVTNPTTTSVRGWAPSLQSSQPSEEVLLLFWSCQKEEALASVWRDSRAWRS